MLSMAVGLVENTRHVRRPFIPLPWILAWSGELPHDEAARENLGTWQNVGSIASCHVLSRLRTRKFSGATVSCKVPQTVVNCLPVLGER